jgi:hypothetical protein
MRFKSHEFPCVRLALLRTEISALSLVIALLGSSGCRPAGPDRHAAATSGPARERKLVTTEFQSFITQLPDQPARAALVLWRDPRGDRESLRWAMNQLTASGWREGYAGLIKTAAVRERFGRAVASASRGKTDAGVSELVDRLVADLLGATLVDAQDELWTAWRALEGLSDREQALAWLLEPPPWPPASVSNYLKRDGDRAMTLIETLSDEVAPEAPARAWLLRSWLSPGRLVDQSFLSELCQAADGRLCREPRFRAWLREEWTAWARQRYRRVARWAGSEARRPVDRRASTPP